MRQETLLCVTDFPANAGYAWDFIEQLFGPLADHLALHGIRTLVAYPSLPSPPRILEGSAASLSNLTDRLPLSIQCAQPN